MVLKRMVRNKSENDDVREMKLSTIEAIDVLILRMSLRR